jgi:hypothetical protein
MKGCHTPDNIYRKSLKPDVENRLDILLAGVYM